MNLLKSTSLMTLIHEIIIDLSDGPLLLINAYMPCDTQVAYHDNQLVFEEVLNDVADLIQISNIDRIVFGGDFNTELSRRASTHTRSLNQFVTNESLSFLSALSCYEVDYTHESDAHGTRSTLDHFIVSSQLVCSVNRVQCDHNALSSSDHTALLLSLSISMPSISNGQSVPRRGPVPLWPKATDAHIANYRNSLSESTEDITLPYEALRCDSPQCTAHTETILSYYNALISLCLSSGRRSIPHSPVSRSGSRRSVPFWSTHVRPLKDSALFWHAIWKSCDSPATGAVANIRRSTRAKYHRAIRYFKQNDQLARFTRMGEYFVNQGRDDFWTEVQKMRGNNSATLTIVDDCLSEDDIALCFREMYNTLYNSVVCNDVDVEIQLLCRNVRFLRSLERSNNRVVRCCFQLVQNGSRSTVSRSFSKLCDVTLKSRHHIVESVCHPTALFKIGNDHEEMAGLVRDLLALRAGLELDQNLSAHDIELLRDINFSIRELCTH
ncbi:hypothetical protein CAPTEDRAFT_185041 [Capitella teleta]|uniref:Endonuclease/exonuclease/phosphatase domain-containing protein n=1 Tax=Capitella teleta TaxID=283909 RepID=R7TE11_CAPTE|nr:hypothetical protein CAPTEDRAFT_185041 [Capitella teleta]|eukprot:ELT89281.1 hypothetical protein CAPTEDRAFT_185041 [Capitella teleta]